MADTPTESAARSQRIVSTPTLSAWVSASAGSGKTKVLTDRALRLMLAGAGPDRILCLTFTKAAAAEMANRIITRLSLWAAASQDDLRKDLASMGAFNPPTEILARAATLFATVVDAPGGLKVQTVHSFCQSALERFPVEAGVPPGFAALDERASAELLRAARDGALHDILGGTAQNPKLAPALERLARRGNAEAFDELLTALLAERARIEHLGGPDAAITAVLDTLGLDEDTADPQAAIEAIATPPPDIETELRRLMTAWLDGTKTDKGKGDALDAWLASDLETRSAKRQSLFGAFFTASGEGGPYARAATKGVLDANAWFADVHTDCFDWVTTARERLWAAECAADTAAAIRLASAIGARYTRAKRVAAGLDFDDLILKTRDLLEADSGAGWALYKLDAGIDHILVDEAQDTNPEQWAIVHALAEEFYRDGSDMGRTLFAVGDPKQSIFSFQRADPAEFAKSRQHFKTMAEGAGQEFEDRSLDVSFRSVPAILQAVDATFAAPEAFQGLSPDGAPPEHISARPGLPGRVELWPIFGKPDKEDKPDRWTPLKAYPDASASAEAGLAARIADKIESLLNNPAERLPPGPSAPEGRRIHASDIMVVVQTRTAFGDLLGRALKAKNIATAGVDRMRLTRQLAVRDLMALGAVAILPEDDLSLAVLLKSPLIGLDEEALFHLAYNRRDQPLWRRLEERAAEPDSLYASAWAFVAEALRRADFAPPFDFYQWALGETQGRARMIAAMGEAARDPLDAFMSLALAYAEDNAPSLQGFLGWIERDQVEIKRQLEEGASGVRILTSHAAKGLQAPVVFLPQTRRGPSNYTLGLFWTDTTKGSAPILGPSRKALDPIAVQALRAAREQRQDEERRRLLYVAMTRAEDRLYVCGWATKLNAEKLSLTWHGLIEAGLQRITGVTEHPVDFADAPMLVHDAPGDGASVDAVGAVDATAPAHALPHWWGKPFAAPPRAPDIKAPSKLVPDAQADMTPVLSPLDWGQKAERTATRFGRGLMIHRLLERLPAMAIAKREAAAARFLARADGVSQVEQKAILDAVMRVLNDPEFGDIFAAEALAETPIAGIINGQPIAGVIDRLLVTNDAVLIVDYKSNRPPPATADATPVEYLAQMAVYRDLAAQAFPGRDVKAALLWTEAPRLVALPDNLIAPHSLAQSA